MRGGQIESRDVVSRTVKRGVVGVHRYLCSFCDMKVPMPTQEHLAWALRKGINFVSPFDDDRDGGYWPDDWVKISTSNDYDVACPRCASKLPKRKP